jgi:hypothetical protein
MIMSSENVFYLILAGFVVAPSYPVLAVVAWVCACTMHVLTSYLENRRLALVSKNKTDLAMLKESIK